MTTLRAMRWWDIGPILTIERGVFDTTSWTAEMFWSELAGVPESRSYFVAEQAGEVAGYAGVMALGAEADVQTLAVAPAFHRRGLASALLETLEADARVRGCSRMFLEVSHINHPARTLYEQRGYRRVSQRRDYYGHGLDALVMQKRLDDVPELP